MKFMERDGKAVTIPEGGSRSDETLEFDKGNQRSSKSKWN
jgi:hypothetical protein